MENNRLTFLFKQFISEFKAEITEEVATSVISGLKDVMALQHDRSLEDEHLTLSEVAKTFKISKSQINKLRKQYKDFPVLKIGTAVRFKRTEVEEFLKQLSNLKQSKKCKQ